jgi:glycosyltransferase involved in cell wall biosynthesis
MPPCDTFRDRPPKVVHVSFAVDPQRRDGETLLREWPTLANVAAAVARAGVSVTIVQASHRRDTVYRDGIPFHFVDDTRGTPVRLPLGLRWPRRPTRILEMVASLQPDVVHVHGFQYPVAIRQLVRRLRGVPVLLQDHASNAPSLGRRMVWRWACSGLAAVAFTTREQAIPFERAGVLRPGIPLFEVLEGSSDFTPGDRDLARRRTGMSGRPSFLWTGHLDANKDPLTVLDAFSLAAPRLPDARLWCCFGTAPLLDKVRRRIADDGMLASRVTLLGFRPHVELEEYFRAADFFVQMSHREGSGYSVIEALACGTTPLVSDIAPLRRVVGDAGSLSPVGDAPALATAMLNWAGRDATALRRAARARFEDALSFETIGRDLRRAYETLVLAR